MKEETIKKLLKLIKAVYPSFTGNEYSAAIWGDLLADIDDPIGLAAFKKHCALSPFIPTPSDIRKYALEILAPDSMIDPAQAWGMVLRAIKSFGYYRRREALNSLPDVVAGVVDAMGWQEICSSENVDVLRGEFFKMFQTFITRERMDALTPEPLKELARSLQGVEQKAIRAPEKETFFIPVTMPNIGREHLITHRKKQPATLTREQQEEHARIVRGQAEVLKGYRQ